jgi:hypothetical protein
LGFYLTEIYPNIPGIPMTDKVKNITNLTIIKTFSVSFSFYTFQADASCFASDLKLSKPPMAIKR